MSGQNKKEFEEITEPVERAKKTSPRQRYKSPTSDSEKEKSDELALISLKAGESGIIDHLGERILCTSKFAAIGFVKGEKVEMEKKAPFGGLLRVKLMNTSISLHHDEAKNIFIKKHS